MKKCNKKRIGFQKDLGHSFKSISVPRQGILLEDMIPYLSCLHFSEDIRIISSCSKSFDDRLDGGSQDDIRIMYYIEIIMVFSI